MNSDLLPDTGKMAPTADLVERVAQEIRTAGDKWDRLFMELDEPCKREVFQARAVLALFAEREKAAHPDDIAIDRFAAAMKAKMAKKRADSRGGWDDPAQCYVERLAEMLVDHLPKGDPVDVGNFAMMLFNRDGGGNALAVAVQAREKAAAGLLEAACGILTAWESDDWERRPIDDEVIAIGKAIAAANAAGIGGAK